MDIAQLRQQYKEVTGKNAFNGWNENQLLVLIQKAEVIAPDKATEVNEEIKKEEPKELDKETVKRVGKELENILSRQDVPVFKDGKPYLIIGNEYVEYESGKKIKLLCMKKYIEDKLSII